MVLLNNLHGSRDRKIGQKDFLLPRPIVFSIPPKDHHSIDRIGLKVLPAFSSPMFLLSFHTHPSKTPSIKPRSTNSTFTAPPVLCCASRINSLVKFFSCSLILTTRAATTILCLPSIRTNNLSPYT